MDFVNPPWAFVLIDGWLAPRLFRSFYRRYAAGIELTGSEDVLEFGCGSGGIAEHLLQRLPDGSLMCADISPPMIRIAERRLAGYANASCRVGRIEDLTLPAASVDIVVIHNALHDIPEADRPETLRELARLLRPGGRLALREPTKPSHGMPATVYRTALTAAGLKEHRSSEYKVFPAGPVFDAVFVKPGDPAPATQQTVPARTADSGDCPVAPNGATLTHADETR